MQYYTAIGMQYYNTAIGMQYYTDIGMQYYTAIDMQYYGTIGMQYLWYYSTVYGNDYTISFSTYLRVTINQPSSKNYLM